MSKHQGQTQATHQAPVNPVTETATVQSVSSEEIEVKSQEERVNDIAELIGMCLPGVMRDRKNMRNLELRVDEFVARYRASHDMSDLVEKQKAVKAVMDQLITASGALESIIMRARPALES